MKIKNILAMSLVCGILATSITGCSWFDNHDHEDTQPVINQEEHVHTDDDKKPDQTDAAATDEPEVTTGKEQEVFKQT